MFHNTNIAEESTNLETDNILVCPESKAVIKKSKRHYFCEENGLLYPEIDGIALLNKTNAVVASKLLTV